MTARSGDALSHVYFQVRQNAVLTEINACPNFELNFALAPIRAHPPTGESFPPYLHGGHEAASRNERANLLHLPITCLNLFAPSDDCIRK